MQYNDTRTSVYLNYHFTAAFVNIFIIQEYKEDNINIHALS